MEQEINRLRADVGAIVEETRALTMEKQKQWTERKQAHDAFNAFQSIVMVHGTPEEVRKAADALKGIAQEILARI